MKIIFYALVLATTSLYAQTAKDVVKQLNGLQGINTLDPVCETCAASQVPALTPQEAIKAINLGKLVYIGRELLAGHDQNRSCVYRSDTAYIIYHNCMGSKKESEATEIEVLSFKGGMTRFYIQNNKTVGPVSNTKRADYDMVWTVDHVQTAAPGKFDLAGIKNFYAGTIDDYAKGSCFIGRTFGAQDMTSVANCRKMDTDVAAKWKSEAESFWKEPGEEWYAAKKYLRKTVLATKY
jgi:hypothetical protein